METQSPHFLDGRAARMLAGLIALVALMILAQIWNHSARVDLAGRALLPDAAAVSDPSGYQAFDKCKAARTADVDRMLSQGLINAHQHADYLEKAIQTCAGRFPPVGGQ